MNDFPEQRQTPSPPGARRRGPSLRPVKDFLKGGTAMAVSCFLASLYIRLARYTILWRYEGDQIPESFHKAGKPFIVSFWHGRLLMVPYFWRWIRIVTMLISSHRDGQLIARTIGHFGIEAVTGSATRGGAQATRQLIRLLRDGRMVGITPDGPRGPRMRVGRGTIAVARLAAVPIVPTAFSVSRRRILDSWDRFILPLPFARGIYLWGDPIEVPHDATAEQLEEKRLELEEAMNSLADRADAMVGQRTIEPDPPFTADGPAKAGAKG